MISDLGFLALNFSSINFLNLCISTARSKLKGSISENQLGIVGLRPSADFTWATIPLENLNS